MAKKHKWTAVEFTTDRPLPPDAVRLRVTYRCDICRTRATTETLAPKPTFTDCEGTRPKNST